MSKCVECGGVIADGGPRHATPIGSFCQECWDKKDPKFKDDMLKRTMYGLAVEGDNFLNKINKKGGKRC